MNEAFYAILIFAVGFLFGHFVTKRTVGERRWRDGYLYGFNLAWDEKAKLDNELKQKHLKEIRRKRPQLTIIKGEK